MKLQRNLFATILTVLLLIGGPGLVQGMVAEDEETGGITGIVNVQATVSVIQEGQTVDSVSTDERTGEFLLSGIAAGTYSIEVYPDADGYKPSMINNVEVNAGETVDLGLIELEEIEKEEEEEVEEEE
jgi:hypothetical protein